MRLLHTRHSELVIAWCVAGAVIATGIYDYSARDPAAALIDLDPALGLALFIVACLATAALASARCTRWPESPTVGRALAVVGLLPALLSDPTYAALIVAIPLIDTQRRADQPERAVRTTLVLAVTAGVLLVEDTPRLANEIEAMLGLATALLLVLLLGDALRKLDRALVVEAQLARLSERTRIAEELHDSLGHHLLAASVQLQNARAFHTRDPARSLGATDLAMDAVADAISETRLIVDASRAEQGWPIEPSIRDLADRIVPSETAMTIRLDGDHSALQPTTQLAIYRVVQEALTNLVRHASATEASIASEVDAAAVTVKIRDNGTGLDAEEPARGGGLVNMRRHVEEAGGSFEIESSAGGTAIIASVPR